MRFGGFLKTQPAIADFDSRWVGNTSQKSTREREPSLLGQLNGSMFGACQKQNTKLPTASYGASVSFHEFHGQHPLCTAQGSKSNIKSRPQLRQLRQPSPHPPAPTRRWHLRWTSDRRASHRLPGRSSGGGAFPVGRRGPAAPRTSSCAPLSLANKQKVSDTRTNDWFLSLCVPRPPATHQVSKCGRGSCTGVGPRSLGSNKYDSPFKRLRWTREPCFHHLVFFSFFSRGAGQNAHPILAAGDLGQLLALSTHDDRPPGAELISPRGLATFA